MNIFTYNKWFILNINILGNSLQDVEIMASIEETKEFDFNPQKIRVKSHTFSEIQTYSKSKL